VADRFSPAAQRLAIFDIDGTLLTGPSTERRFYRELLRTGNQGPRQILAAAAFACTRWPRYGRDVFKKNKAYLAWLTRDKVARLARDWVERELTDDWFAPAVGRLRGHQERGDRVLLLSGTPEFLARAIAARLAVDEYIGSRCATRGDRFDWRAPLWHPFGEEKRRLAQDYCARVGIAASQVTAYGDSGHDIALLDWCGQAVAVRPEPRLLAAARQRNWEILGDRSAGIGGSGSLSMSR
jgi:HAD superfamily phosphoserine phosphatase-like hydrolase